MPDSRYLWASRWSSRAIKASVLGPRVRGRLRNLGRASIRLHSALDQPRSGTAKETPDRGRARSRCLVVVDLLEDFQFGTLVGLIVVQCFKYLIHG
jgi:hypothetical protein